MSSINAINILISFVELNELEEDKQHVSGLIIVKSHEKDSPGEESSSSSFEHISEQD